LLIEKKNTSLTTYKTNYDNKKKKRTNKFTKRLYRLVLSDKHTLIYIETIYATKFWNCTILDLELENKLQDLSTIATATSTTRLKIAFEIFQK